jgi:hypothetical protein
MKPQVPEAVVAQGVQGIPEHPQSMPAVGGARMAVNVSA